MSKLQEHPFVTATRERAQPLLTAALNHLQSNTAREDEARSENRARLNASAQYVESVYRRTVGLMATIQTLEDARRVIRVFPAELGRGTDGVSRNRWIDYHYGYFTISLASLSDVGLLLAATVLRTGLSPKHSSFDIVLSHDSVKGTGVATALRRLSKSVELARRRRNVHVHRAEHADVADLSPDGFLWRMKLITAVPPTTLGSVDRRLLQAAWREATRTIVLRLDEELKQAEDAISGVFNALFPIFTRRHDILQRLKRQ
ncbi:MAG: Cthe_2314 family HEPN domain-containing protein [Acidobacteria bacterium]|nr:Cthe_2314 family HEPN domain-containing protein [Acidobacteriota bacterium]